MTDHKFTDDDIIKGLEGLAAYDCKRCLDLGHDCFEKDCDKVIAENALALINRQKAEIESLQAVHADMTESLRLAAEANKDMQAEIEKLGRDRYQILADGRLELIPRTDINAIKAEAIKEFAERLKADMSNIARMEYGGNIYFCVGYDLIDTLVKEMTEEQTNESQST